jgi:hypothetical protein
MRYRGGGKAGTSTEKWNHQGWMDPHPGQYSTVSLRPWPIMSGLPMRRPRICSLCYRDKLPISYTVSQLKRHTKTMLGFWRAVMETTSWWQPTCLTKGQDQAVRQVTTGVCSSCQAAGALGPSQITCGLHPEGGHTFIHQQSERLRTEAAPPHRQWQVTQQRPQPGP